MNDNAIIRLIRNGDVDAFAQLVQKYHKNLLAFIYRFVQDPHLTEDIGQEVFLDVYKSLSKFDPGRWAGIHQILVVGPEQVATPLGQDRQVD